MDAPVPAEVDEPNTTINGLYSPLIGSWILKTLFETSEIPAFSTAVILTKALSVLISGTVQSNVPSEASAVPTESQEAPLSAEYSIFTLFISLLAQVIFCTVPLVHSSPPFGEITVTDGAVSSCSYIIFIAVI